MDEIIHQVETIEHLSPRAARLRTQILLLVPQQGAPDIRELIDFLYDQLNMEIEPSKASVDSEDSKKTVDSDINAGGPVDIWLNELENRDQDLRHLSIEKIAVALESANFGYWYGDWLKRCILKLRETSTEKVMHDLIFDLIRDLEEYHENVIGSCIWCGKEIEPHHHLDCAERRKLQN